MEKDRKSRSAPKVVDGGTVLTIGGKEIFIPHPSPSELVNQRDTQCNLSALLILIVEQHAVISELLSFLTDNGLMHDAGLARITNARNNPALTSPIYSDLYERFSNHFLKTKWFLLSEDEKADFTASAENLANDEEDKDE